MDHFDEDKYSLSQRVARMGHRARLGRGPAVAAAPFHHQRAHLRRTTTRAHLVVESAELLFRSRGDVNDSALVSCGREDVLRRCDDRWKLARRKIIADESVLRMQNLAVFL